MLPTLMSSLAITDPITVPVNVNNPSTDASTTIATILISRVPVRDRHCTGPKIIIDRFDLWRAGAHALWLTTGGIRVKTVAGTNSVRPWSRYPRRRRY